MEIKLFDCVKLTDGQKGTVIEVFDGGKAFMVEITDSEGQTLDTPIVTQKDISKVTFRA